MQSEINIRLKKYAAGFEDGAAHARAGKPLLSSLSDYGSGFAAGWKAVRRANHPSMWSASKRHPTVAIDAPRALTLVSGEPESEHPQAS